MAARKKRVTVHGVVYASQTEAAKALGLKPATICSAIKRNSISTIGKGSDALKVPTYIRGVLYESQTEAARSLGVGKRAIHMAAERGSLDSVGMCYNATRPIECDGTVYDNIKSFAEYFGWKPYQVYNALAKSKKDDDGYTIWKGKKFKKMKGIDK